ncbi:hypothetical protein HOLleu_40329 [Holothuria leucospilota]|uniref:Uncharacterized protein n=1 Tax=Holothuria leucospilota TaxID=206669 RepID=A0A9Q0YDC6_HOLLE|nr:hypothetical protein HOLleu_40329 [Holothuria leucospilota]
MALEVTKSLLMCGICVLFLPRIHAQDMAMATSVDSIDIFGVCADILGYQRAQPEPLFERNEAFDIATVTGLASVLCPDDLLPAMCSLFFPPQNITGLQLCPEACYRLTIECLVVVPSFTEVRCDILPSGQDVGNGLCRALASTTEESETLMTSGEGLETLFRTVLLTETLASDTGQPEAISTGAEIFGTLVVSTEESEKQSTGQPVTMLNRTMSPQTQGTTAALQTSTRLPDTASITSELPETSSISTVSVDTGTSFTELQTQTVIVGDQSTLTTGQVDRETQFSTSQELETQTLISRDQSTLTTGQIERETQFSTSQEPEGTSSESPETPSSSPTIISTSPSASQTPEDFIEVFGVCSEYLNYTRAQPEPLFEPMEGITTEAIISFASTVFCNTGLLPTVCSLIFPPLASTGLQVCTESCSQLTRGCLVVVSALTNFDCGILPAGPEIANDLCMRIVQASTQRPETPSVSSGQPETSSISTEGSDTETGFTELETPTIVVEELSTLTTGPIEPDTQFTTSQEPETGGMSTELPETASAFQIPEEFIDVFGVCAEYLSYQRAQPEPLFQLIEGFSIEQVTTQASDIFCEGDVLPALCVILFPPLSSTGLQLCNEDCDRLQNECSFAVISFPNFDCEILPPGEEIVDGLCMPSVQASTARPETPSVSSEQPETSSISTEGPETGTGFTEQETAETPSSSPGAVSTSPSDFIEVFGVCTQHLNYSRAQPEPLFPLLEITSIRAVMALSVRICEEDVLPDVCSLLFPPLASTGLIVCFVSCVRVLTGCPVAVAALSNFDCVILPPGLEIANGFCVPILQPSTEIPETPSDSSEQPETSSISTAGPETETGITERETQTILMGDQSTLTTGTVVPDTQIITSQEPDTGATSSESPETPSISPAAMSTSPSASQTTEDSIEVFGVCTEYLNYQRAQPEPLFQLREGTTIEEVTRLASTIFCDDDLLPAVCLIFFPPLESTGLQICSEFCGQLHSGCPIVVASLTNLDCDILPPEEEVADGVCMRIQQTSTERPETPSVTSRQPETSSFSTDGPETTPASTTELPVIQSSPATSSESPQPPSTSTLAISTSTPGMVTPEELINVGGMCAEDLPYNQSLSRPAFMALRSLSSELATLLIISNNVCAVDLIVGMCSLFYPPSALTGLSLCQETCQRMFLNIGGCPIISSFLDVDVEDCAMFPEEKDQGNGLCLPALPSTALPTTTSVSTEETQTPSEPTLPVNGVCADLLPYGQSLSRPLFMDLLGLPLVDTTALIANNNVCAANLQAGMCSLFYPPPASTGLSLCPETCQALFAEEDGCPIISSFLDVNVENCVMFPEGIDQGNGLCRQGVEGTTTQAPLEITTVITADLAPVTYSTIEITTLEISIDVFGVCSEELSYQRAQPQPLFQIDSSVSIERITQLASLELLCPAGLLFGICSIFFPPLASTGLQLCPETCVDVITGCPVVAAVFSAGECDILPQGQDTGNGLCQGNIAETIASLQPTSTSTGTMSVQQTTVPPSTSPEILTLVTGKTLEQTTRATTTTSETPDTACVPVAVRCQDVLPYSVAQRTMSMEGAERALDIFRPVLPCDEDFLALLCSDIFRPCPGSGFGTGYCSDQCSSIRNECLDEFDRFVNLAFPVDCSSLPNNIFNGALAENYGLCN